MKTIVYPINYIEDLESLTKDDLQAVGIEEMGITYVQPADTCSSSDEVQHLTITSQCGCAVGKCDKGFYFNISIPEGEHWSVDDGELLTALVNDFKQRLYQQTKSE